MSAMPEHWSVTVTRNGEPQLTISDGAISGANDFECDLIVGAAQHLLAFVGFRDDGHDRAIASENEYAEGRQDERVYSDAALAEVEVLKDWIREQGEHTDTCTFNVLREICSGCCCKRGAMLAKVDLASPSSQEAK